MAEFEYEYRVMHRERETGEAWDEWSQVYTNRGAGRPMRTIGACKGLITREQDTLRRRQSNHPFGYWKGIEVDYKIQRRPVTTEWEDVDG